MPRDLFSVTKAFRTVLLLLRETLIFSSWSQYYTVVKHTVCSVWYSAENNPKSSFCKIQSTEMKNNSEGKHQISNTREVSCCTQGNDGYGFYFLSSFFSGRWVEREGFDFCFDEVQFLWTVHLTHTHAHTEISFFNKSSALIHTFAFADHIHLSGVACSARAEHPHTSSFDLLGPAALISAGAYAIGHFDHLVGSTVTFFQVLPVLFLLTARGWNREFSITMFTTPTLPTLALIGALVQRDATTFLAQVIFAWFWVIDITTSWGYSLLFLCYHKI